jgi:hypothetical protein
VTIDIRYNHDLFCHAVLLASEVRISWLVVHLFDLGVLEVAELDDAVGVDRDQISTPTVDGVNFLDLLPVTSAVGILSRRTSSFLDLYSYVAPWSVDDDIDVIVLSWSLGQRLNAFPVQKLNSQVP